MVVTGLDVAQASQADGSHNSRSLRIMAPLLSDDLLCNT